MQTMDYHEHSAHLDSGIKEQTKNVNEIAMQNFHGSLAAAASTRLDDSSMSDFATVTATYFVSIAIDPESRSTIWLTSYICRYLTSSAVQCSAATSQSWYDWTKVLSWDVLHLPNQMALLGCPNHQHQVVQETPNHLHCRSALPQKLNPGPSAQSQLRRPCELAACEHSTSSSQLWGWLSPLLRVLCVRQIWSQPLLLVAKAASTMSCVDIPNKQPVHHIAIDSDRQILTLTYNCWWVIFTFLVNSNQAKHNTLLGESYIATNETCQLMKQRLEMATWQFVCWWKLTLVCQKQNVCWLQLVWLYLIYSFCKKNNTSKENIYITTHNTHPVWP